MPIISGSHNMFIKIHSCFMHDEDIIVVISCPELSGYMYFSHFQIHFIRIISQIQLYSTLHNCVLINDIEKDNSVSLINQHVHIQSVYSMFSTYINSDHYIYTVYCTYCNYRNYRCPFSLDTTDVHMHD